MRRLAWLLTVLAAAAPAATSAETVWVAAAASLREPVSTLTRRFEAARSGVRVMPSFGASSLLATQLSAGAPVDVLLSADARQVDALVARGELLGSSRRVFASNALVVVCAAGRVLEGPEDLARVTRFALPPEAVPLGHYARAWLSGRGLLEPVAGRAIQTLDARATLAAVDLGQVDAAIVYATDAALARRARVAFVIPEAEQPRIVYVAALTPRGAEKAAARDWLDFVLREGRAALRDAGFLDPPPEPGAARR